MVRLIVSFIKIEEVQNFHLRRYFKKIQQSLKLNLFLKWRKYLSNFSSLYYLALVDVAAARKTEEKPVSTTGNGWFERNFVIIFSYPW